MTYAGLIIDGPLDGQRVAMPTSRLVVEQRPPTRLSASPDDAPPDEPLPPIVYRHFVWCGVNLWILEDETIAQVIRHMTDSIGFDAIASRYEQITARRKEDTRHSRSFGSRPLDI